MRKKDVIILVGLYEEFAKLKEDIVWWEYDLATGSFVEDAELRKTHDDLDFVNLRIEQILKANNLTREKQRRI